MCTYCGVTRVYKGGPHRAHNHLRTPWFLFVFITLLTSPNNECAKVVFPGISYRTYLASIGLAVALLWREAYSSNTRGMSLSSKYDGSSVFGAGAELSTDELVVRCWPHCSKYAVKQSSNAARRMVTAPITPIPRHFCFASRRQNRSHLDDIDPIQNAKHSSSSNTAGCESSSDADTNSTSPKTIVVRKKRSCGRMGEQGGSKRGNGNYYVYSPADATHLRRRRRRRALGVRCNDGCPATGARERREARGIGTEVGVAATDGGQ